MLIVKYETHESCLERLLGWLSIKEVSIDFAPPLISPSSVTLWASKDFGVRIYSKIFDTTEKNEVGYLTFSCITNKNEKEARYDVGDVFNGKKTVEALTVKIDNCTIWAGLRISNSKNDEIKICAHEFPYSVTAKCSVIDLGRFKPEFDEEDYSLEPIK